MSEDESFVILGTSPKSLQSFTSHGKEVLDCVSDDENNLHKPANSKTIELRSSDQNISPTNSNEPFPVKTLRSEENSLNQNQTCEHDVWGTVNITSSIQAEMADPIMMEKPSCLLSLEKKDVQKLLSSSNESTKSDNDFKNKGLAQNGTLAASFLMGEIDLEDVKKNVYSKFPSLNNSGVNSNDIVKLQGIMTEYTLLKETVKQTNKSMRQQFTIIQKWQDCFEEHKLKQNIQINSLEEKLLKLQNDNTELKTEIERTKCDEKVLTDRNEILIKELSEQNLQIKTMAEKIETLEKQQLVYQEKDGSQNDFVSNTEHTRVAKEFEFQLSELKAKNVDLENMKQVYIDELNCFKVSLVSAEELLKQAKADICILQSREKTLSQEILSEREKREQMDERIVILNTQVEVYSKDFEMEREAREKLARENDDILQNLKLLQKRNQQLIEEQQARYIEAGGSSVDAPQSKETGTTRKTSSASKSASPKPQVIQQIFACPLCDRDFNTVALLEVHVQDCIQD